MSIWITIAVTVSIMTFGLLSLFFGNMYTLTKNITKIDLLKGNFALQDKLGMFPNPFDLGCITNFATVFSG